MFNKRCPRCDRKASKDFDFCPYCGMDFRPEKRVKQEKDFGLLGREDNLSNIAMPNMNVNLPFGFNSLFNSLLKEVDKQFRELDKDITRDRQDSLDFKKLSKKPNASGISISISTANGKQPEIKVNRFGSEFKNIPNQLGSKEIKIKNQVTTDQAKKLAKLPRKEAEASVRRMSNKIVYEVELPGVKNLKDVIISKLENSTEIKAFSDKTVYVKLLPVKMPIVGYKLEQEKLIIEFRAQ